MPRTLSAERAARLAEKNRQHNRSLKTSSKSYVTKAEELITGGDVEKARAAVKESISKIDIAVKKNVLHANTGARRKSKLVKTFNKAFGAQTQTAVAKPPAKKRAATRRTAAKKSKPAEPKAEPKEE